jgi:IMP dehydrogenase
MAFYETRTCLCFDDVLLTPKYSEIDSRHNINLTATDVMGRPFFCNDKKFSLPIFASPMDTVVDEKTAAIFSNAGISPILHRYCTAEQQVVSYKNVINQLHASAAPVGAAIGAGEFSLNRMIDLYDAGCRFFCVDVAHGHHKMSMLAVSTIKHLYPECFIMAGNVATLEGFDALANAGADAVRVGIGGGSVCSTRIVTGHGTPTLQSIIDCAESESDAILVADGGIRSTGDMVKSYAAGADFVMLGSMLSCKDESPGEEKIVDGVKYKNYRGMASASAQKDWRGKVSVTEGVDSWRPVTNSLGDAIATITAGIRSGLSYSGCEKLSDFYANSEFIKVSARSSRENVPHGPGAVFR